MAMPPGMTPKNALARLPRRVGVFAGDTDVAELTLEAWFTDELALIVPALSDRPAVLSAASAGVVAVLANDLPYRLGLIVAALAGIAVGILAESRK